MGDDDRESDDERDSFHSGKPKFDLREKHDWIGCEWYQNGFFVREADSVPPIPPIVPSILAIVLAVVAAVMPAIDAFIDLVVDGAGRSVDRARGDARCKQGGRDRDEKRADEESPIRRQPAGGAERFHGM